MLFDTDHIQRDNNKNQEEQDLLLAKILESPEESKLPYRQVGIGYHCIGNSSTDESFDRLLQLNLLSVSMKLYFCPVDHQF
jgi:hypothetical protein